MTPAEGYAEAAALHARRLGDGWQPVGRKIGFTNRTIWPLYGVYEPIWGTVYDRTLIVAGSERAGVRLDSLAQPRIEPEICFRLRRAPRSSRIHDLLESLDWVAHSIEIVQCRLPGWKGITVANSTAENGLHGLLILGKPVPVARLPQLAAALPHVEARLCRADMEVDRGSGENVLGSPLLALGHLVELLARQPQAMALAPGEIVTTGTLTDAHPVAPGETWSTRLTGMPLEGLELSFT